jgi:PIN domain nuclease of toxin-antitoxin system
MGQSGVILLDTHIVLWLAESAGKLSPNARAAIDAARADDTGLAICDITLAELATIYGKRRFTLTVPLDTFLEETESRFTVVPITARACARSVALPASYPRDPADRIIGATALVEGLPLLTADRAIRRSKALRTIW